MVPGRAWSGGELGPGAFGVFVDVEDAIEAADLEDLADRLVERAKGDTAAAGLEPLRGHQDHAQPGAADVVEVGEIDQQPLAARVEIADQFGLKRRTRVAVETPLRARDLDFVRHGISAFPQLSVISQSHYGW